jgi:hypothetical protein
MEGRRHDWTLFVLSGLDNQLDQKLGIGGTKYCLYGDSGYSQRDRFHLSIAKYRHARYRYATFKLHLSFPHIDMPSIILPCHPHHNT